MSADESLDVRFFEVDLEDNPKVSAIPCDSPSSRIRSSLRAI